MGKLEEVGPSWSKLERIGIFVRVGNNGRNWLKFIEIGKREFTNEKIRPYV